MNSKRRHNLNSNIESKKLLIEKQIKESPNIIASYSYQIRNSNGELMKDSGERQCHSFVANFARLLYNCAFFLGLGSPVAITDTGGTSQTAYSNMHRGLRTDASTGTSTYGLQVGTGTGAESINNTSLGTQIAHGSGSGQLQYGAMSYGAPSTTGTTTTFRFTRVFTNASGGSIGVEEIGLVSNSGDFSKRYLWLRDLTGTITVNNGQSLTLNVDFTTTI